jgi:hypothetical protein
MREDQIMIPHFGQCLIQGTPGLRRQNNFGQRAGRYYRLDDSTGTQAGQERDQRTRHIEIIQ